MFKISFTKAFLFFVFLTISISCYSQTVTDIKGDIEFGNLAFEDLGEEGFIVLSRLNDNQVILGSKQRQLVGMIVSLT